MHSLAPYPWDNFQPDTKDKCDSHHGSLSTSGRHAQTGPVGPRIHSTHHSPNLHPQWAPPWAVLRVLLLPCVWCPGAGDEKQVDHRLKMLVL